MIRIDIVVGVVATIAVDGLVVAAVAMVDVSSAANTEVWWLGRRQLCNVGGCNCSGDNENGCGTSSDGGCEWLMVATIVRVWWWC